jgi:basic membrane protein A and related proteins
VRRRRVNRAIALFAVLALGLAACGGDDDDDTSADEGDGGAPAEGEGPSIGLVYDIGGRGDQSFNDSAFRGLEQAAEELGADTNDLEPDAGGENRGELLQLLAEEGRELIFGIGFLFTESVTEVAQNNPETTFAIVDAVVEESNVASLTFAEEEGSFIVGAAAALKSQTGTIGFIGGVETELILKFQAGYEAGARAVNPDINVLTAYITQPPDFTGFNAPERAREIADNQYSQQADVIYHAAGGSGQGLFEAARETSERTGTKVWAIGVDSDQAVTAGEELGQYILTSMLKNVDAAVFQTAEAFAAGDEVGGQTTVFDLEAGGIDYATTGGFVDDIADQLDDFKEQIIAGDIEVPTAPE